MEHIMAEQTYDHDHDRDRGTPRQRGVAVVGKLFGESFAEHSAARFNAFDAPLLEHIIDAAFGTVWSRPELDLRARAAITLAMLTTLRALDELELHTRAALRNGLTPTEIREIVLQAAVYAGIPASVAAFEVIKRTLGEAGALHEDGRPRVTEVTA
jgi:alkylhydroperoxidase/carboxymuconolactone decarboxylase family protein YurZ